MLQVHLAKDPNQRFQNPAQLQKALTKVRGAITSGKRLTAEELRSVSAQVTANTSKRELRKQTVRWLLGVGLCIAGGLIAWFFYFAHLGLFNQRAAQAEPTEKSIAVLPFENISPNKDDAYFADGVQDEILNNLAKIAQLKVICRTSVMQYRPDTKRDLREIANALGVANVLEGTVRRDGNHVRISTELVDARNYNTIWADSYDRDLTDIFAIQTEIAQKVASRLSATLSPEESKDIARKPTENLEAYDLYLQSKQLLDNSVLPSMETQICSKTIGLLKEATRKDPNFALAHCLIVKAHDMLYVDRIDRTPERRALGDAAANEALKLRPDLPEVHLTVASHLYACRNFERARVQIAIAARGLPNSPDLLQLTALIDRVQGRWETATVGLERAATLDPRNTELLANLAETYGLLKRYRDAKRIVDRLITLKPDNPTYPLQNARWSFQETADVKAARVACDAFPSVKDDPWVAGFRAHLAICARDFTAAEEILDESPTKEISLFAAFVPRQIYALWVEFLRGNHPTMEQFGAAREQLYHKVEADPTDPFVLMALALADVALGRKEEAIEEVRRAMEMRPISEDAVDGPYIAWRGTLVYVWANQPDLAFEQLDILIEIPDALPTYGDLKTYPGWDPLRKDPRFDKLLAELAPRE